MNGINGEKNLINETSSKKNYNKQLQKYLREVAFLYDSIPVISVNGIANVETTKALKAFQEVAGLEPTGIADPLTWELLRDNYLYSLNNKLPQTGSSLFQTRDTIYEAGDSHPGIFSVQHVFLDLSENYLNFIKPDFNGTIDEITAENIREFRRISMLPEGTHLDIDLWNILFAVHNFITKN